MGYKAKKVWIIAEEFTHGSGKQVLEVIAIYARKYMAEKDLPHYIKTFPLCSIVEHEVK